MISTRLLNVLRSAGVGVGVMDVTEWVDMLTFSIVAGVLRLGDYNIKLIDSVYQAWDSKAFVAYSVHDYTYGNHQVSWLDADQFKNRAARAHTYLRLPHGHPVKATYSEGRVVSVHALSVPGEYANDITDAMQSLFPSGVDKRIKAVYAIVSASEPDWSREAWRAGMLVTGERAFISGMDKLTLACVDGYDLQTFCDDGILGALSVPVIEKSRDVEDVVDSASSTRCTLVAISNGGICALYCSRLQTGEILAMRVGSGAGTDDVIYLDLDTGDTLTVTDLLALKGKCEGDEVYYVSDKGAHVLCDEYGNFLLGANAVLF